MTTSVPVQAQAQLYVEQQPREPGWQKRFVRLVDEELAKPFDWITANCGDLVACSILACHGNRHPILRLLEKYETREEVEGLLKSWNGLNGIFMRYFEIRPHSFAMQADICTVQMPNNEWLGGVICDGLAVFKAAREGEGAAWRNVVRLPIRKVDYVYRV